MKRLLARLVEATAVLEIESPAAAAPATCGPSATTQITMRSISLTVTVSAVDLRRLRRCVPREICYSYACSSVPPFDRYAVIPIARNVGQHVEGGSPAAAARCLNIAGTTRRSSAPTVSRRPVGSTLWKSAAFRLLAPGRLDVLVEERRRAVVGRHVVPLPALLVEPELSPSRTTKWATANPVNPRRVFLEPHQIRVAAHQRAAPFGCRAVRVQVAHIASRHQRARP